MKKIERLILGILLSGFIVFGAIAIIASGGCGGNGGGGTFDDKDCDVPKNQEPPFMDISGTWDLEIIPSGKSKLDGVVSYYQTSNDDYPDNLSGIFYNSLGEGGIFTGAISGYEIYWDWGNGDKVKILVENVYQENTFNNVDDLDDPISIPVYEDDDGIPELTIDTTVRELSNYHY